MIYFKKLKLAKLNRGMTYVELIVVLGIFATMSSVAMFNHGAFQAKVDIRNLANDIALKIVQAQKESLSGKLSSTPPANWKPSYGVFFNSNSNSSFIYFVDLDNGNSYGGTDCTGECLEKINITKGNTIQSIVGAGCLASITTATITFQRPSSSATFITNTGCVPSAVAITVQSPKSDKATITVDASGRVRIN